MNLAPGSFNAIAAEIDANAEFGGKFRRVAGKEVAVTTADFKDDGPRSRQDRV